MIVIRQGTKADLPQAFRLIQELAAYEKAADQVTNTIEKMEADGFGSDPSFAFLIAEENEVVAGLMLYYWRYSTWTGRRLYVEDIIVTRAHRGRGIGKRLFDAAIVEAKEKNAAGLTWQVLDWNEPAINFYKKYNAKFDAGWVNCHIEL